MPWKPQEIEELILYRQQRARFTQDSPILADVWMAYAQEAEKRPRIDLLLASHRQSSAGELCEWLRRRLSGDVERKRRAERGEDARFGLAFNDSHVAVRLTFEELIRVALPLTRWWQLYLYQPPTPDVDATEAIIASCRALQDTAQRQQLARLVTEYTDGREHGATDFTDDLLWFAYAVGRIQWEGARTKGSRFSKRKGIDAFADLVQDIDFETLPAGPVLWSINRNRLSEMVSWKSVPTTKADAAQRVFQLSCRKLTWAVIDSGIDARHPAFRRRREDGSALPDAFPAANNSTRVRNNTRVVATYDFTRIRDLLEVPIEEQSRDTMREAQDLARSLRSGRSVDWGRLEAELRIEDDNYVPPENEHGTHVAGILAGDWREADDVEPPQELVQGMCPDLNLYDLRVLDENGQGQEFWILAALQFIRYLNMGKDQPTIHGANISISISHDMTNYACGQTPVCEECERLIGNGVVVVAAAGNDGFAEFSTSQGRVKGYRTTSITDPGNGESVITVGATHRQHPHTYGVSYFSSRGPTGDGRSKPDLVAPGEKINAPIPNGRCKSLDGTSMAAPHVSGACALLMSRHTELKGNPRRIKQILCESATDLGRDRTFQGHGMVDVLRALQSI